jgi:predicted DCC family thiol-disulfide oxidoreductase YuxK
VEKSPRLNWATQFLTVAYDGACSPNVCQNGVNFLRLRALQGEKKKYHNLLLDVVEIARVA